jgi:exodeoxyribonuclease VII small subunit
VNDAPPAERTFEQNLAELEAIVRELEDGKTNLETAIARYEQGVGLLKTCTELLRQAEQKIILLTGVDAQSEPMTEPFHHEASVTGMRSAANRKE